MGLFKSKKNKQVEIDRKKYAIAGAILGGFGGGALGSIRKNSDARLGGTLLGATLGGIAGYSGADMWGQYFGEPLQNWWDTPSGVEKYASFGIPQTQKQDPRGEESAVKKFIKRPENIAGAIAGVGTYLALPQGMKDKSKLLSAGLAAPAFFAGKGAVRDFRTDKNTSILGKMVKNKYVVGAATGALSGLVASKFGGKGFDAGKAFNYGKAGLLMGLGGTALGDAVSRLPATGRGGGNTSRVMSTMAGALGGVGGAVGGFLSGKDATDKRDRAYRDKVSAYRELYRLHRHAL